MNAPVVSSQLSDQNRLVSLRADDAGIVTVLMRDETNRNAFSERFVDELRECLDGAAGDPSKGSDCPKTDKSCPIART